MLFEELISTKDKELRFVTEPKKYIKVKKEGLIHKPCVYEREFDFRGIDAGILKEYGLEPKVYVYVGSHVQYSMTARNSKQRWESRYSHTDEMGILCRRCYSFVKHEVNPGVTYEDIENSMFYSNICYFYVDTIKEARELETRIYNELIMKDLMSDNMELLISERNDSSLKVVPTEDGIRVMARPSGNGCGVQPTPMRFKFDSDLMLRDMSLEQMYSFAFNLIGYKVNIDGEQLEVSKDNFADVFSKMVSIGNTKVQ